MDKFRFPSCFDCETAWERKHPKTIYELEMIRLSAEIREKANWSTDIKKPKIVEEWKKEFCSGETNVKTKNRRLKIKIFNYVLAELHYYISLREDSIEVGGVDRTWQSDDLIQEPQRKLLMDGIMALEKIQMKKKDLHPGSNGQVWALVHPSLYAFVKGKTPVLRELRSTRSMSSRTLQQSDSLLNYSSNPQRFMAAEEISDLLKNNRIADFPDYCFSKKFQWLPSEFQVDVNGSVKITSYINNLHPDIHSNLYRSIEDIFQKFVPLFNKVLTNLINNQPDRVKVNGVRRENRLVPECPIPTFLPPKASKKIVNLAGMKLQVFVKLTNIQLTPETPEYTGGPWHVEGMANERIVGTGIYYYETENIAESRLLFRQSVSTVRNFSRSDVETVFGLKDKDPLNQNLGSIVTKRGRCIAFPNTLQHHVAPFKLENDTLPGHRKILVFHLVDPSIRILSTAQVPPQQKSWFVQEIYKEPGVILPEEIVDKIVGMLGFPISMKEAKKDREELMQERGVLSKAFNDEFFETKFHIADAPYRFRQLATHAD